MPNDFIKIEVKGIEELQRALMEFPRQVQRHLKAAGEEAGKIILKTEGVSRYPPADSANAPPTPYYKRGVGMQYKYGNNMKSEKYGTSSGTAGSSWSIKSEAYKTTIGSKASYGKYLGGAEQSHVMAARGWRKLYDVAMEKMPQIVKIFDAWIGKLLVACKLK